MNIAFSSIGDGGLVLGTSASSSPHPAPNGFFALAYDPQGNQTVFFGGESQQSESEREWLCPKKTWAYDGHKWWVNNP